MDRLWTPWRLEYITGKQTSRKGVPEPLSAWPGEDTSCVFCNMLGAVRWAKDTGMPPADAERAAGILHLETHCFVCLNAFPYTSGHLMILPYLHTASLAGLPSAAAQELIALAQRAEIWLRKCYEPDGLNFPRWTGDASFMTTTADTRILPETPLQTWNKLRQVIESEATSTKT